MGNQISGSPSKISVNGYYDSNKKYGGMIDKRNVMVTDSGSSDYQNNNEVEDYDFSSGLLKEFANKSLEVIENNISGAEKFINSIASNVEEKIEELNISKENAEEEVISYIDALVNSGQKYSMNELISMYQSKSVEEAQIIAIDKYKKDLNDDFGFNEEESLMLLNREKDFKEIFDLNYKEHMAKYMDYLCKNGLDYGEYYNSKILEASSYQEYENILKEYEKNNLMSSGFNEEDATKIVNGEKTAQEIYSEICSEESQERRYEFILKSLLSQNGYENIDEDITILKNNIDASNEYYYTNNLIQSITNMASSTRYVEASEESLIEMAKNYQIGYYYTDVNGDRVYEEGRPKGNQDNIQIVTYYDIYGNTESFEKIKKEINENKYVTYGSFSNLKKEISIKLEEREELIDELNNLNETKKYFEKYASDYTKNIFEYTRKDDFNSLCTANNDVYKDLIDLNNFDNYNTLNFGGAGMLYKDTNDIYLRDANVDPTIVISDREEIMKVIYASFSSDDMILINENGPYFEHENYQAKIMFNDGTLLSDYEKWFRFFTEEEKSVFTYIYNKEGYDKAYEYLENMADTMDRRWVANQTLIDQDYASEHPYIASISSVILTPFEGISAFGYSIDRLLFNEKIRMTHTYSSGDVYRGQVASDIARDYGKGWSFIYSTGMSMADSVSLIGLTIATGGAGAVSTGLVSAGWMGSRAYVSTLNSALERGLSDGKAVTLALASATVETAMESYSVGHLLNLENSLNAGVKNTINSITKNIENETLKRVATKTLTIFGSALSQGLCEAEEEFCTEVMNSITEEIIAGDLSEFNMEVANYIESGYTEAEAFSKAFKDKTDQCIEAALGGFLSGFGFGSFGSTFQNHNTSKKIARDIITEYNDSVKGNTEINNNTLYKLAKNQDYEGVINNILNSAGVSIEGKVNSALEAIDIINKNVGLDAQTLNKLNDSINKYTNNSGDSNAVQVDIDSEIERYKLLKSIESSDLYQEYLYEESPYAGVLADPDTRIRYDTLAIEISSLETKLDMFAKEKGITISDLISNPSVIDNGPNTIGNEEIIETLDGIINKLGKAKGRRALLLYSNLGNLSGIPIEFQKQLQNISSAEINNYLGIEKINIGTQFFGKKANILSETEIIESLKYGIAAMDQKYEQVIGLRSLRAYLDPNSSRYKDSTVISSAGGFRNLVLSLDYNTLVNCYNKIVTDMSNNSYYNANNSYSYTNYQSIQEINNAAVNQLDSYENLSIIEKKVNSGRNAYSSLVAVWNSSSKTPPTNQMISKYYNRFRNSGLEILSQGGSFSHICTRDFNVSSVSSRLYINNHSLADTLTFTTLFANKCEERGIPYYFKIADMQGGVGSIEKSNFFRDESIVIYSSDQYLTDYVNICNEIKAETNIEFSNPPILTAKLDGFIGYGSEPRSHNSYNKIRSELIAKAIEYSNTVLLEQYRGYSIDDILEYIRNDQQAYQEYLNNIYNYIYMNASSYGISPTKFFLNN